MLMDEEIFPRVCQGMICTVKIQVSGVGHNLNSTCRYQKDEKIILRVSLQSPECPLSDLSYKWEMHWLLSPENMIPNANTLLVLPTVLKDRSVFEVDSNLTKLEGDSKGIFAVRLQLQFTVNSSPEVVGIMMFTVVHGCSNVEDACSWIRGQMKGFNIMQELQAIPICREVGTEMVNMYTFDGTLTQETKSRLSESTITTVVYSAIQKQEETLDEQNSDLGNHTKGFYFGCYRDSSRRDLTYGKNLGSKNTPESCIRICTNAEYFYAGLQHMRWCFCGDKFGKYGKLHESHCQYKCSGDPSQKCGGTWANSIYSTGKEEPEVLATPETEQEPELVPEIEEKQETEEPTNRNKIDHICIEEVSAKTLTSIDLTNVKTPLHCLILVSDGVQNVCSKYLLYTEALLSWKDAQLYCQSQEMDLVVIESDKEMIELKQCINQLDGVVWVGADLNRLTSELTWVNKHILTPQNPNWHYGEPNCLPFTTTDCSSEHIEGCIRLTQAFKLRTSDCSSLYHAICEELPSNYTEDIIVDNCCTVSPLRGYSSQTIFDISCNINLSTTDGEYNVYADYGTDVQLIATSQSPFMSVFLNAGPQDKSYMVNITVQVEFQPPCVFSVQVFKVNDQGSNDGDMGVITDLIGNGTDTQGTVLSSLLESGDHESAVNLLGDVLSTLNTEEMSNTASKEEKKQVREVVVANLKKVTVTSIDDLNLVTDVLNSAVSVTDELSESTQDTALDMYSNLTGVLSQQVNQSTDVNVGERTAGLLLGGLSSMLDLTTNKGTKLTHANTTINTTSVHKVEEDSRKILSLVDSIADVALAISEPSTEPTVFVTSHMNVAIMKNTAAKTIGQNLVNSRSSNTSTVTGSFKLPSDATFSQMLDNIQGEVNLQMMLIDKNPFVWDASSDSVTTPVISLKVKDTNKQLVKVDGLQEPIRVEISNQAVSESSVFPLNITLKLDNGSYSVKESPALRLTTNITQGYAIVVSVRGQDLECPFQVLHKDTQETSLNFSSGFLLDVGNNFTFVSNSSTTDQSYSTYIKPLLNATDELFWTNYATSNNFTTDCNSSVCEGKITVNFIVETYSVGCIYWDEKVEVWTSQGCQVAPQTTRDLIHCECYHLTSFSGSFLVLPNMIDPFADAALFLTFFENPVVVTTVVFIWFLYFSWAYWARKADKKDAAQSGVVVLSDANPNDNYQYLMCVVTGWWGGASTSARVSCYVTGNKGISTKHCLSESVVNKAYFKAGWEDWFLFTSPYHLGNLESVTLWHDNFGKSPSWFLTRVLIQDLKTNKVYSFIYGDWIGVERGTTKATIPCTTQKDLYKFRNQEFTLKSSRDIRDSHLWFSVFSKPCRSRFTRVQRLTCCLSLLLCTMLTSIMFHGIPTTNAEDQAQIGQFSFSLKDLIIGIECAIIMLPINILIVQLFMRTGPKPRHTQRLPDKRYIFHWDSPEEKDGHTPSCADMERESLIKNSKSECSDGQEAPPLPKMLPWWCLYIAWTIVITVSLVCSYFTMLYGLKYGYQKSLEWLVSFFTAFFQSACFQQPIKVIAIAMVMTYIFKKPVEIEGMTLDFELKDKVLYVDDEDSVPQHVVPDPASKSVLNRIKAKLHFEGIIEERLREIILYSLFVTVVLFTVHGNRNVRNSYWTGNALEDIFVRKGFKKDPLDLPSITSVPKFWDYLRVKALPGLDDIYNGNKSIETHGDDFILVGPFRFRQLRIQNGTCPIPVSITESMGMGVGCYGDYSLGDEDTQHYNGSWDTPQDTPSNDHWSHQTSWELGTIPYTGILSTYSGGGYTFEMFPNSTSQQVINDLQSHSWIDDRTRAVFLEFTLYNPNINLFSVVMFLFEFSSNGGVFPFHQIFTTKMYHYSSSTKAALVICEILFFVFTLIFTFYEVKKCKGLGYKKYFAEFWNVIEFIIIALCFTVIALFFQRMVTVDSIMDKYRASKGATFVSFYTAVFWDFIQLYVMGFLVFILIVKFLKILSFNQNMHLLSDVLQHARNSLYNFSFMITILIIAFSHFAYLIFGPALEGYKSILNSLMTMFNLALGVSDFYSLYYVHNVLGPLFFLLFILFVMFIYLTVFMAIVNFSISDAKSSKMRKNQFEVIDYLINKFANILPIELAVKLRRDRN